jgi:hypothetical protein
MEGLKLEILENTIQRISNIYYLILDKNFEVNKKYCEIEEIRLEEIKELKSKILSNYLLRRNNGSFKFAF